MAESRKTESRRVAIGSTVLVSLDDKRILSLIIGGVNDGNPSQGIISCDAPLAKAILGKHAGDVATYIVGDRTNRVKIIRVAEA